VARDWGRSGPLGGTGDTVHTGSRLLPFEVSCILLFLSTKSRKQWPIPRLQATPGMRDRSQHKENSVIYHINTANQIYIFLSYINDITVKKDCTVFTTTDPYSLKLWKINVTVL
jgi:hypothetical protein